MMMMTRCVGDLEKACAYALCLCEMHRLSGLSGENKTYNHLSL
jgi:hypothetical protein